MNKHVKKIISFPINHPFAFAAICGGAAVAAKIINVSRGIKTFDAPEGLQKYGISLVTQDDKSTQLYVNNLAGGYSVPLSDLGVFGEKVSDIPGVDKNQNAWVMMDILNS